MKKATQQLTLLKGPGLPHVYNYAPNYLATWRAARSNLSARPKVLFIGDSKTMGAGVGTTDGSTFTVGAAALNKTKLIADILATKGYPCSRQSVIPANGLATVAALRAYDVRLGALTNWILSSGTFISLGGNVLQLQSTNVDALAFSPEGIVDTVDVLYIRGGSVGHFTIDDGGAALVDVNGAGANALIRVSQALSSRGSGKTINIKRTTANTNSVYIAGVIAYDSTVPAIEIVNAGRFGSKTADWNVTTNPWNPIGAIGAYAPKLTFINLGANDLANAVSPSTGSTNLQAVVTAAKASGDVVIVNPAMGSRPAWGTLAEQTAWRAMLQALAVANTCPMIDENEIWGGYSGDASKFADGIHENTAGTTLEAAVTAQLMAA